MNAQHTPQALKEMGFTDNDPPLVGLASDTDHMDRTHPERASVPDARVEEALQVWALNIAQAYTNGNKGYARAMFRQVPGHRRPYVTMKLMDYATTPQQREGTRRFIISVTE